MFGRARFACLLCHVFLQTGCQAPEEASWLAVSESNIYEKSCRQSKDTRHLSMIALPGTTILSFDANLCAGAQRSRSSLSLAEEPAMKPAKNAPMTVIVNMGADGPNDGLIHAGASSTAQRLADAGLPVAMISGAGGPASIEYQMRTLMQNEEFRQAMGDQPLNVIIDGHGQATSITPSPTDVASLAGIFAGSPLSGVAATAATTSQTGHDVYSEFVNPENIATNVGKMVMAAGSPFAGLGPLTGAIASQQPESTWVNTPTVSVMSAIDKGLRAAAPDEAVAVGGGPIAALGTGATNPTNFIVDACYSGAVLGEAKAAGYDSVFTTSTDSEVAGTDPENYQGLAEKRYTDALIASVENGTPIKAADLLGPEARAPYGVSTEPAAAVMGSLAYGASTQTPMTSNPDAVFYDPNPKGQDGGDWGGGDWGATSGGDYGNTSYPDAPAAEPVVSPTSEGGDYGGGEF